MTRQHSAAAMIFAAGYGSRLKTITADKPKALVPINGIPLIERVIGQIRKAGISQIIVNAHHHANQVIEFLKSPQFTDLDILISDESAELLDTGGGLLKALPFFGNASTVLVHNVDIITSLPLESLIDMHRKSRHDISLLISQRDSSRKLLFDQENLLRGWKNTADNQIKLVGNANDALLKAFAFNGIHVLNPIALAGIPVTKCSLIDLYLSLAASRNIVGVEIETPYWFDLGKPEQLVHVAQFLQSNRLP